MFHSIVDHVGLMLQLQPSLTESRLQERLLGQILILLHRFSFLVRCKMMDATEVSLFLLFHGCTTIGLQMRLVPSIEPEDMTMESSAHLSQNAETVTHMNHALFQMSI
jgi:hypothetical protein